MGRLFAAPDADHRRPHLRQGMRGLPPDALAGTEHDEHASVQPQELPVLGD